MIEKEVIIPINGDKEYVDKINKKCGTDYKTTEEHIGDLWEILVELIGECGDRGGWYISDHMKVTIKVEYCPENK